MGLQLERFRKRWSSYLGKKDGSNEALTSLQNALDKTEPDAKDLAWAVEQDGEKGGESKFPPFKSLERLAHAVNPARQLSEEEEEKRQEEQLALIHVVAFVGPSGTGKTTIVLEVARAQGIHYFIDDGLLIHGSRIICGTSAKRAPTRMESVRQAIFLDEIRARNMKRALAEQVPERLMILGTSDSMLEKICKNLGLAQPVETIRIEDITTPEERRIARQTRLQAGQHTIPVPSLEIKHEFNGSFFEPFHRLKKRFEREKEDLEHLIQENEKTVVQPTFSSLGSYSISDEALNNLVRLSLNDLDGVAEVMAIHVQQQVYGLVLEVELALYYGYIAQEVLQHVQQTVSESVEQYTSMNVLSVPVRALRLKQGGRLKGRGGTKTASLGQ